MAEIIITKRVDNAEYTSLNVEVQESDGTVLSHGSFKYVDSCFGKGKIKVMLAGGVGTPVHFRRGGHVRKTFEKMHRDAAEEGAAVALLHPFSFAYYRKFGYEKVADHLILRFPTRMIDFVPRCCNFVPYDEDTMAEDMVKIYNTFSVGRNLLLPRFKSSFGYGEDKQVYICYKNEEPIAYVIYSTQHNIVVNHYDGGLLTVHEQAYTCPEGLREIFSFLRMFEGEYDDIEIANAAMCPEVDLLLKNYTHTSYQLLPDIMARVLNTEKVLLAADYPEKDGEFIVKVEDELPTVDGTFKVTYGGGNCTVTRGDFAPDLVLSSSAFSRLVYGYDGVTAEAAKYMDGVRIENDATDFFRVFTRKPCGIFEHF